MLRNHDFDWAISIDLGNSSMFVACRKHETQSKEYDGYLKHSGGANWNLDVRGKPTVVQNCTRSHISVSF
jgi:hypothetical protein